MRNSARSYLLLGTILLALTMLPVKAKADPPALSDLENLGGLDTYLRYFSDDGSMFIARGAITGNTEYHAYYFTPGTGNVDLGTLGGTLSYAQAMSDDGSIIMGASKITGDTATNLFRWTQGTGMVDLGNLGGTYVNPIFMTGDGSVISGWGLNPGDTEYHVFRWTQGTGLVDIGTLGGDIAIPVGMSSDGSIIVGYSYLVGNSATRAFRWTQGTGLVDMGTLGGDSSSANVMTADGTVFAGDSEITGNTETHAYRWTQGTGMVDIGTLGGTNASASHMSSDGNVIFGTSLVPGNTDTHIFRWTQGTGMVDILGPAGGTETQIYAISEDGSAMAGRGNLVGDVDWRMYHWTQATGAVDIGTLGGTNGSVSDMSADGSVLIGYSQIAGNATNHAFVWRSADGIQDLNTVLADGGVNMTGIELISAELMSRNGEYILAKGLVGGNENIYLVYYTGTAGGTGGGGGVGITTGEAQIESTDELATTVQGSSIGTRSMSNVILGSVQPMRNTNTTSSGAMFGSAMGYANAEYTREQFTVLGGFGYGSQEYEGAELHAAPVFAAALRYSFGDIDEPGVIPFLEGGGSITPFQDVTFSRSYANGAGTATGKGTTETTGGLWYARAGSAWNVTDADQVTAFGEYGQQYLNFKDYYERDDASNPFPAHIDGGTAKMDVVRAGGSWSHDINDTFSVTVSGAVARSLNVDSDLTATVSGVGTIEADSKQQTWGEYGARLETRLTDEASLNFVVNGTKGGSGIGNDTHGGVSVSYKF